MATQPKIRVVKEADEALDQVANEISAALTEKDLEEAAPSTATKTLIAATKEGLVHSIDRLRVRGSDIERDIASANADYEKAVTAAKTMRDERIAECKAELFQVNETISALDAARARLSARA